MLAVGIEFGGEFNEEFSGHPTVETCSLESVIERLGKMDV